MKTSSSEKIQSASQEIDARIEQLADWRGEMLARLRALIKQADPQVVEECKWKKPSNPLGTPVWYHDGILCTGGQHRSVMVAEDMSKRLKKSGYQVKAVHRDIPR